MIKNESFSKAKTANGFQLTPQQTNELLNIVNVNQKIAIGKEFGSDFLTDYDKKLLKEYGVDVNNLSKAGYGTVITDFNLGMLSDSLQALEAVGKVTYDNLKEYIKGGKYIPLTAKELAIIDSIKTQSLTSIKGIGNKIFQDVNGFLEDNSRKAQEEFLRQQVLEGYLKKRTERQIASDIAHKTGDWGRDFESIIEHIFNTACKSGYNEKTNSIKLCDEKKILKQPRLKIKAIINGIEVWI